jgi:hypothetical protein
VKAGPFQLGVNTLESESPREPRARASLTRWWEVADSRVEQSPEGEGRSAGLPIMSGRVGCLHLACSGGQVRGAFQRQEGNGAGDGVRLHGRSNALEGEPQERIRHETRPAGSGRMKAPGG